MLKSVETTGKTVEDAITAAVGQLGTRRDNLDIEVLEQGEKGFLGIIGSKEARIRATVKLKISDVAQNYVEGLIEKMGIKATVTSRLEDTLLIVELAGDNMGLIIGKHGETLDSIRYLLSLYVNRISETKLKVILNTEDYLRKREETLTRLADNLADKVVSTKKRVVIEPMNSYERKIIHTALQNDKYVTTHSEGNEPYRRVVIELK
ncbi:MAG: protein jag [Clostridiales bacterium]|nr:protein jag [Clostridiales bacterium]